MSAQTFNSLEQNGNEMLSVINTWQDPCHLEFVVDAANGTNVGSFNSGAFNINNSTSRKAATPTTWAATGPSGSVETSSSEVTNNNNNNNNNGDASTPTTTAGANGAGAARMVDRDKGPSFGAGVGVGIAISVVIGALVVATFWLAQRARNGKGGRTYAYMDPPGPGYVREWPPSRPPMEMPGEGARVEMPAVRY